MNKGIKTRRMIYSNTLSNLKNNGIPTDSHELAKYIESELKPSRYAFSIQENNLATEHPVESTIRIILEFTYPRFIAYIAKLFKDEQLSNINSVIPSCKLILYLSLIHWNHPTQKKYQSTEVISSFDFSEFIDDYFTNQERTNAL
ncbi:hypothetical protein QuyetLC_24850 [Bacillus anthracis]|uniref:Uncharacterized protein n=1 Tax=Bacillus anthracis TaxID=1392 RepID=A0A640MJE5_BACAN|nr:hypothetical protein [Enterococcus faecalis]GEU13549.1 hypothetical protein QuyetLC_24850 [Bacillus anthracis]